MKRFAALVLPIVALAGCASTPPEVLLAGHRYEYASASTPRQLAGCTAANASAFSKYYAGDIEPLVRPDTYQVVVTEYKNLDYEPVIVAHAAPTPTGSQIVVFVSKGMSQARAADWAVRLRKGCEIALQVPVVVPLPPRGVPVEIVPSPRLQPRGTRG